LGSILETFPKIYHEELCMRVSLYGAGQVNGNVARILGRRRGVEVLGPWGRADRARALGSGADLVVIATTSFLAEVAPDIRDAVRSHANVITTAEEAAFPWANDPAVADELDRLARDQGVTVLGAGLNPGYAFDALVLTATGVTWEAPSIRVERVVDLGGFGEAVLRRIGVGYTPEEFEAGVRQGEITGHIGFPQSMQVVAGRLGVEIERIDRRIEPIFADRHLQAANVAVAAGRTAGFAQHYVGVVGGRPWFQASFLGHIDPGANGTPPRDEIHVDGPTPVHLAIVPGLSPQIGASAVVANSARRVIEAPPGWVTVADLPPAHPE
jgi:2,4-diaminopentanoate dehydrogenase